MSDITVPVSIAFLYPMGWPKEKLPLKASNAKLSLAIFSILLATADTTPGVQKHVVPYFSQSFRSLAAIVAPGLPVKSRISLCRLEPFKEAFYRWRGRYHTRIQTFKANLSQTADTSDHALKEPDWLFLRWGSSFCLFSSCGTAMAGLQYRSH